MFTIYDHDRLVDDDIAGEVYYDLQFVPGLSHETVRGGFATVQQVRMPFMISSLEGEPVNSKFFFDLELTVNARRKPIQYFNQHLQFSCPV